MGKTYEDVEEELEDNSSVEIEEHQATENVDLERRSDSTSEVKPNQPNKNQKGPTKRKPPVNENKADLAFTTMQSVISERETRRNRDEYSAYGEVVGHKIRKLATEYERNLTQYKINQILHHASMGHFRQNPHGSHTSQLSSPHNSLSIYSPLGSPMPHETRETSSSTFSRPSSSHTTFSPLTSPNTPCGENAQSQLWENQNAAMGNNTRDFYEEFGTTTDFTNL